MEEFVVALHMERREEMSESHTVRVGVYLAESLDDALGMAVLEHVDAGWERGGWTGGPLKLLRGQAN